MLFDIFSVKWRHLRRPHNTQSIRVPRGRSQGTSFELHYQRLNRSFILDGIKGDLYLLAFLALDADLFIIESSFFRDKKTEKHLELAEAMYLVRKAKPKRAMLTHFYAEWDAVDFVKEITVFEPACEVLEAFDGLRLDLS